MRHSSRWTGAALIVAGLGLSGCAQASDAETTHHEPATVESIAGTKLARVTLEERAVQRLGVRTARVQDISAAPGTAQRKIVPYSAVLYDSTGATWVYTNPKPLVFVRHAITVDYIERDQAVLSDGPASGTAVVSVGAAELFGTELGVDH